MPVRIYDISKKLGLENKEVLSKAKALGIAAARVASSSLDKITAEYLEQQLIIEHPHRTDWKLMAPEKPSERSRDVYRFQVAVPAGKSIKQEVVEAVGRMTTGHALENVFQVGVRLAIVELGDGDQ